MVSSNQWGRIWSLIPWIVREFLPFPPLVLRPLAWSRHAGSHVFRNWKRRKMKVTLQRDSYFLALVFI